MFCGKSDEFNVQIIQCSSAFIQDSHFNSVCSGSVYFFSFCHSEYYKDMYSVLRFYIVYNFSSTELLNKIRLYPPIDVWQWRIQWYNDFWHSLIPLPWFAKVPAILATMAFAPLMWFHRPLERVSEALMGM